MVGARRKTRRLINRKIDIKSINEGSFEYKMGESDAHNAETHQIFLTSTITLIDSTFSQRCATVKVHVKKLNHYI